MTNSTEVPAKRHDPNYIQLSGDVRKELGLQFKAACTLKQLSIGLGLEEAIEMWLRAQQAPNQDKYSNKGDE
ncbi:MAG: hypothetical protein MUE44_34240 [Oscillatoriaceae cyanobacterium Prado104]|nr:hypothetical protein [Oscillatoriaceae cyanobacterium Prado104]